MHIFSQTEYTFVYFRDDYDDDDESGKYTHSEMLTLYMCIFQTMYSRLFKDYFRFIF